MKTMLGRLAALFALTALSLPASAVALLTYTFSGNVLRVDEGLSSVFTVNDAVTGTWTVDTTTPAVGTSAEASYNGAVTAFAVRVGTYLATSSGGYVLIQNGGTRGDVYNPVGLNGITGASVGDNTPAFLQVFLADDGATIFGDANAGLPTGFSLEDFNLRLGEIRFISSAEVPTASAVIFSLTSLTAVPEPSTLALLGVGLIGLAWRRHPAAAAA